MEESKVLIYILSDAWKVRMIKRNLNYNRIKALSKKKGVIGMNAFNAFIKKTSRLLMTSKLDYVDYISDLIGKDYICI